MLLYFENLWDLFVDMSFYIVIGLLFTGLLHAFVKKDVILKHIGKDNTSSVVKASIFGVPLPLCSCGVVPTAMYLGKSGASKGSVVSFLVSTPQTGVDSLIATYGMMGSLFAVYRAISAFISGIFAGVMTNLFCKNHDINYGDAPTTCGCSHEDTHADEHSSCCCEQEHEHEEEHASCCCGHEHEPAHEHKEKHDCCCSHEDAHKEEHTSCCCEHAHEHAHEHEEKHDCCCSHEHAHEKAHTSCCCEHEHEHAHEHEEKHDCCCSHEDAHKEAHTSCCCEHAHEHEETHDCCCSHEDAHKEEHTSCCCEHAHEHAHEHEEKHDCCCSHEHAHEKAHTSCCCEHEHEHAHEHEEAQTSCCCGHEQPQQSNEPKGFIAKMKSALQYAFGEFLDEIAMHFAIGLLIAALITTLLPESILSTFSNPLISMLLMIAVGIPMYICSTASIPIAVSLMMKGISPGAAFVFLFAGPVTNIASLTILLKTLGKKVTAIYLSSVAFCAIAFGLLLDYIIEVTGYEKITTMLHPAHEHEMPIYMTVIAILFGILVLKSLVKHFTHKSACACGHEST